MSPRQRSQLFYHPFAAARNSRFAREAIGDRPACQIGRCGNADLPFFKGVPSILAQRSRAQTLAY
jgi:hypothetical protein